MLKTCIFILVTCTLLFTSCTSNNNSIKGVITGVEKDSSTQITHTQVYVSGSTKDSTISLKYFNLIDYDNLFGGNQLTSKHYSTSDSVYMEFENSGTPQLKEIMIFDSTFTTTKIFVTPGDTIHFQIKNKTITFEGSHTDNYNFFTQLYKQNYNWSHYKGDIKLFKKETDSIYHLREKFLQKYLAEHTNTTDAFKQTAKEELFFEYYYNLIAPRDIQAYCATTNTYADIYYNNTESVLATLANSTGNIETEMLDLQSYFNNIQIDNFKKPTLLTNDYYKKALVDFTRFYFNNSDYIQYSKENFKQEKKFILQNYSGSTQTYLLTRLVTDYYKHGLGKDQAAVDLLQKNITELKKNKLDKSYSDALDKIESQLSLFNTDLPKIVFNDLVITPNNDTIPLSTVLKDKKIKLIDIWASWCAPCLNEIKKTDKTAKQLITDKNIEVIYISIDQNHRKWLQTQQRLSNHFLSTNHYTLVDPNNSKLLKFFHVKYIPRHIILNSKNKVLNANAPDIETNLNQIQNQY
ncbi:TlpA family protein disulfide reductase [Neptunitalea lumnitzerae]|uniref:Thioredoxin domain-containing protein n=1 Tax=Neptunitalea lumnitzerae TaxID=2965509 RepID=A0ABQ5MH33_9FLAO|nr:thioredoxin-like domain-containing protein [Neptunitalea sp. Y10]GLB48611.1 hypothetical protein Y10_09790 [Neptunitalea sp. Y10]